MPLTAGDRLGPYEVLAKLGEGGMGEVYRARDTQLNRDVAIKILPELFSADHERLARFTREAQTLAALNHPNIAQIYGLDAAPSTSSGQSGDHAGARVGAGRRRRSVDDHSAWRAAARRCADDRAPDRGGPRSRPRVRNRSPRSEAGKHQGPPRRCGQGARFRPRQGDGSCGLRPARPITDADRRTLRTRFRRARHAGRHDPRHGGVHGAGTSQRKAGRQACRHLGLRRRALRNAHGRRAFGGDETSDVLAAVLRQEIDWKSIPGNTPPRLRRVLERCLERDPRTRLRDIGEARVEIAKIQAGDTSGFISEGGPPPPGRLWRHRLGWITSGVLALALVGAGWMLWAARNINPSTPLRPVRLVFDPPPNLSFDGGIADSIVVSPDGRLLVFSGRSPDGRRQLWTQALDSGEAKALPGTEDALMPFWSPDSRSIGFGSKGKLRRLDLAGGRPQVIANAPRLSGGTWNRDGVILFVPDFNSGVVQVSANGGEVKTVTVPDAKRGEASHRAPAFLQDGRHFLYNGGRSAEREIWWGSLDSADRRRLTSGGDARAVPGWLLFIRDGTVLAQAFDAGQATLAGDPIPIATAGYAEVDVSLSLSENGVLVSKRPFKPEHRLSWFDRAGSKLGDVGPAVRVALSISPRLSPDETRVVVQNREPEVERRGIWVHDLARGLSTRLSSRLGQYPQWSPDGSRIAWLTRNEEDVVGIYEKRSNGVGDESPLLKIGAAAGGTTFPTDWSSDGRFLLYYARSERTRIDIWALPLFGDRKPYPVLNTEFDEHQGQLSPDGRWLAYRSDVDGSYEIYVRSFTTDGHVGTERQRISIGGGSQPRFRRDGRELFYLADDGWMMAVALTTTDTTFNSGPPKRLFKPRMLTGGFEPQFEYDVTRDGQRFLIGNIVDGPEGTPPRPMVILNWAAELKR